MKTVALIRLIAVLAAFQATCCMKPDPAGPGPENSQTLIGDDDRQAGATSSTNWPQEDVGTRPIQITGTADSVLAISFTQALTGSSDPVPARLAATFLFYRAGYNPLFDSVPTLRLDFPESDTCKIPTDAINPLIPGDLDTIRFTVEVRVDTVRALFPGFIYSNKQKKFLASPHPFNDSGSVSMTSPHYKFAGIPDSGFQTFQSDTSGNTKLYYYIPGTPYFWPQSLGHDSLYIGPTVNGRFPLRCVKVVSQADPKAAFTIDVYALSLVKELVNDSLHHSRPSTVFKLGESILHTQGQGTLLLRTPGQ